jgi:hypothetical protein
MKSPSSINFHIILKNKSRRFCRCSKLGGRRSDATTKVVGATTCLLFHPSGSRDARCRYPVLAHGAVSIHSTNERTGFAVPCVHMGHGTQCSAAHVPRTGCDCTRPARSLVSGFHICSAVAVITNERGTQKWCGNKTVC